MSEKQSRCLNRRYYWFEANIYTYYTILFANTTKLGKNILKNIRT